jgi:hypothetical protein
MQDTQLAKKLAFLRDHRHQDEATLLAQAVQAGIQSLYREALIEAYLLGQISRDAVLKEVSSEELDRIDDQRDALLRDVTWAIDGP